MESSIKNERYILVSENDSFQHIFFAIADKLNKKRPSIRITPLISNIFWRLESLVQTLTGRKPILTKQSAKSAHNKSLFSNKKIKEGLDVEFEPLEKTINTTCEQFLKDHS